MNNPTPSCYKKTSIGGQAVIEGIMMRGPVKSAMANRLPDGTLDLEEWETYPHGIAWYNRAPLIRGCFNFVETLVTGFRCLMTSAEKAGFEEEEPSAFEQKLAKLTGKKTETIVSTVALVLGVALAVLLFMVLPATASKLLAPFLPSTMALTLVEGGIKIAIFLVYIALVSQMKDIHRVFEYHGAEHKTIACYEHGEELTVENIRKYTRFHPRCGTSFLLIVLIISILVSSVVTWNSLVIRVLLKLLMLPIVVSISYEIIKLAGRYDNPVTRIVSAPGLWLQRLTTREPDDGPIEAAIAAMTPVIPDDPNADRY